MKKEREKGSGRPTHRKVIKRKRKKATKRGDTKRFVGVCFCERERELEKKKGKKMQAR